MAHPYNPFPHPYKNRAHRIFRDMPLFYYIFLAIYRILCYVIRGATSTPVDGSPFDFFLISFGGNLLLYYPQSVGKGGGRYVRYMGQFVSVLYGHSGCHSRSLSDDKQREVTAQLSPKQRLLLAHTLVEPPAGSTPCVYTIPHLGAFVNVSCRQCRGFFTTGQTEGVALPPLQLRLRAYPCKNMCVYSGTDHYTPALPSLSTITLKKPPSGMSRTAVFFMNYDYASWMDAITMVTIAAKPSSEMGAPATSRM